MGLVGRRTGNCPPIMYPMEDSLRHLLERPYSIIGPHLMKRFSVGNEPLIEACEKLAGDPRFQNDESRVRLAAVVATGVRLMAIGRPIDLSPAAVFLCSLYSQCSSDTARRMISGAISGLSYNDEGWAASRPVG